MNDVGKAGWRWHAGTRGSVRVPEEAGYPLFAVGDVVLRKYCYGRRFEVEEVNLYSSLKERAHFGFGWWTYNLRPLPRTTERLLGTEERYLVALPAVDRLADLV